MNVASSSTSPPPPPTSLDAEDARLPSLSWAITGQARWGRCRGCQEVTRRMLALMSSSERLPTLRRALADAFCGGCALSSRVAAASVCCVQVGTRRIDAALGFLSIFAAGDCWARRRARASRAMQVAISLHASCISCSFCLGDGVLGSDCRQATTLWYGSAISKEGRPLGESGKSFSRQYSSRTPSSEGRSVDSSHVCCANAASSLQYAMRTMCSKEVPTSSKTREHTASRA